MLGGSMCPVSPDEIRSEEDFNHGLGRSPRTGMITTMATMALMTTKANMVPVLQVKKKTREKIQKCLILQMYNFAGNPERVL